MTLIRCPRCGTISESAAGGCPRCAAPAAPYRPRGPAAEPPRARRAPPRGGGSRRRALLAVAGAAIAAAAATLALRIVPREGTLSVEIDGAGAVLSSPRIALVTAERFAAFRAGHATENRQHAIRLQQQEREAADALDAYRNACAQRAQEEPGSFDECFDNDGGRERALEDVRREYRELKVRWYEELARAGIDGGAGGSLHRAFRVRRSEPHVLIAWAEEPDTWQLWSWCGLVSLEGKGEKLVTLGPGNRTLVFPFRDPPTNF